MAGHREKGGREKRVLHGSRPGAAGLPQDRGGEDEGQGIN